MCKCRNASIIAGTFAVHGWFIVDKGWTDQRTCHDMIMFALLTRHMNVLIITTAPKGPITSMADMQSNVELIDLSRSSMMSFLLVFEGFCKVAIVSYHYCDEMIVCFDVSRFHQCTSISYPGLTSDAHLWKTDMLSYMYINIWHGLPRCGYQRS